MQKSIQNGKKTYSPKKQTFIDISKIKDKKSFRRPRQTQAKLENLAAKQVQEEVYALSVNINYNPFLDVQIIDTSDDIDVTDCGFHPAWFYACTPWKPHSVCVANVVDGAWVPFCVKYIEAYYECELINELNRGEFDSDFDTSYRI